MTMNGVKSDDVDEKFLNVMLMRADIPGENWWLVTTDVTAELAPLDKLHNNKRLLVKTRTDKKATTGMGSNGWSL